MIPAPYQRLVALAEREHDLSLQGDVEALALLDTERNELIASLPATPPPAARPALVAAARIQAQTTAALQDARSRLAGELAALDRGRATARGYERAAGGAAVRGTITVAA